MSVRSSRDDELGDAVDMARDDMAAELVADLQRAFEIEPRALLPGAGRGHPQGLGRGIDRDTRCGRRCSPVSTTVRQTPECAIEAPIAMEARG